MDGKPITLHDLACQAIDAVTGAPKRAWGNRLLALVRKYQADHPDLAADLEARLVTSYATYASNVQARRIALIEEQAALDSGVSVATGLPVMTPTLSVRGETGRQLVLWEKATPMQFHEAVMREQQVINGRHEANAIRLQIARRIAADEKLADLPTVATVLAHLGINVADLALDELSA